MIDVITGMMLYRMHRAQELFVMITRMDVAGGADAECTEHRR